MRKRNIQLKIMVTPEEDAQIRKNAKACDVIPSAYIRNMALHMHLLEYDLTPITSHCKELASLREAICRLVDTIIISGRYVPADLDYIRAKMTAVLKLQGSILREYDQFVDQLEKELKTTVQNIVTQHLAENIERTK